MKNYRSEFKKRFLSVVMKNAHKIKRTHRKRWSNCLRESWAILRK